MSNNADQEFDHFRDPFATGFRLAAGGWLNFVNSFGHFGSSLNLYLDIGLCPPTSNGVP